MSDTSLRIVIVGAGPGGLTAARALRAEGFAPIVLDKRPADDLLADVGGAYDLGREVISLFRAFGLEDQARSVGMSWKALEVYDGALTPIRTMDMGGLEVVSLRRAVLQHLLADGMASCIRGGCEVIGVHRGEVIRVELAGAEPIECDVLIGADGVHSAVRRAILADGPPSFCGAMAAWGSLHAADPALRSLPHERGHLLLGPTASAGGGGMGDRYVWSVMWPSREFEPLSDASARERRVREVVAAGLPGFLPVLEATDPARVAVVGLWDRAPGSRWSAGRAVLIGDAAHATSPTLGQGAQSAMVDGFTLARLLALHPPDEAIARYEQRRMAGVNANILSARRMNRWWFSTSPRVQWMNRAMLRWVPASLFRRSIESANRANEIGDLLPPGD